MIGLPRILLAKVDPNVFRNEPRNIGLVLYTPEALVARYVGENPDAPGEVLPGREPPFVNAPEVYRMWVRAWRRDLVTPADVLGVLRRQGLSNFWLAEMGYLTDPLTPAELPAALDRLFADLVAEPPVATAPVTLGESLIRPRQAVAAIVTTD